MCSVKRLADLVKSMFLRNSKRLSKRSSWDYLLQCPYSMNHHNP